VVLHEDFVELVISILDCDGIRAHIHFTTDQRWQNVIIIFINFIVSKKLPDSGQVEALYFMYSSLKRLFSNTPRTNLAQC
jgi:prolipoprotein diacylglyceryltransferase